MISDQEDRILEAALEEVLGGQYPPDLSAKILQALESRSTTSPQDAVTAPTAPVLVSASQPLPPPVVASADPVAPPVHVAGGSLTSTRRRRRRRRSPVTWLSTAVAITLLFAMVGIGVYLGQISSGPSGGFLAESQPPREIRRADVPDTSRRSETGLPNRDDLIARSPEAGMTEPRQGPSERETVTGDPRTEVEPAPLPASPTVVQRVRPSSDPEVITFVNDMLAQGWRQRGVTPAPPAGDTQWCQRVYKRLIGRDPTQDELQQFQSAPADQRRSSLVDDLLARDEYARHWSAVWADTLLGNEQLEAQSEGVHREGLERYLFTSLRDDKPYDQMATELVSATGACDPEAENFNGAANFLAAHARDDYVPATDRLARVFLGKQLVCARCHDHPANGWDQEEFWKLNAFLRQMKVRREAQTGRLALIDKDFFGETGVARDAEIFYQDEDGRLRVAYPEFGSNRLSRSGLLSDVNRRRELARLIVASPDFRSAVVNRVWAELLEYGFVEPVDDAGPHNPPSHPELLRGLSEQLAAHNFDMDGLIRWIVLSRAFEVSDEPTPESWMDTPETGGRPLFARYYGEPAKPADLYKSLMLAVRSRPPSLGIDARTLARRSWTPSASAVPQIIDTQGTEGISGPGWLDLLADSQMPPEQKVEHLFLSVLDRKPSRREKMAAKLVLADRMNETSRAHPHTVDEFGPAGLEPAPSRLVRPPRVAESPAALECLL
ncbi:MAG: DUF1549 domain-containing protein, partial [Planctomycetes bacterium]|nr:DUF1549 domain-containing protein [Planctomycetota bacterium]